MFQKRSKKYYDILQLNISFIKKTRRKTIAGTRRKLLQNTIAKSEVYVPSFLKQGGHLREATHVTPCFRSDQPRGGGSISWYVLLMCFCTSFDSFPKIAKIALSARPNLENRKGVRVRTPLILKPFLQYLGLHDELAQSGQATGGGMRNVELSACALMHIYP